MIHLFKPFFMAKQFVIKDTTPYQTKAGEFRTQVSYFGFNSGLFNHMRDLKEAKKYNSRAEALADWRKYFRGKPTARVVPFPEKEVSNEKV